MQDRGFGIQAERPHNPPSIFSIDFYHVSNIIVIDLRPDFDVGQVSLMRKRGVIDSRILDAIQTCAESGLGVDERILARYAQYIYHAVNQVRSAGANTENISMVIGKGPIENFFGTERWEELKAQFGGRVGYPNLTNLFKELIREEAEKLPYDLISGNKLAGVLDMWKSGEDPNFVIPKPDLNNLHKVLNN